MPSEPSPQRLFWDVTPRRPAPSSRVIEQQTEPGSKQNDPLPSFLAADSLKKAGTWHRQLWTVYRGLRRFPGLTAAELTERLGLRDRYICNRRLPELRDRFKLVCNGRQRRCTVSPARRLSQTWYCSRPFFPKNASRGKISAPARPVRATAPATAAGAEAPVLTVEERQRLRRKLAAEGHTWADEYTVASASPEVS